MVGVLLDVNKMVLTVQSKFQQPQKLETLNRLLDLNTEWRRENLGVNLVLQKPARAFPFDFIGTQTSTQCF